MSSDLSLHKAVFSGDLKAVENILKRFNENELNIQDIHGNTALHIAVMKGNISCVQMLVKSGAVPTIRNELNWMCLNEAISYGDFDIIKILNDCLSQRIIKYLKRDFIFKFVDGIKENFALKFELRLKDYKPTTITGNPELKVSVTKKGLKIRADVLLMDCFHTRPQEFQLIFDLSPNNDKFITITVGGLPVYQTITFDYWEQTLTEIFSRESTDDEIREIMGRENISIKMDWSSKLSDRSPLRRVVTRRIAGHRTDIYESQGIDLTTRTRFEHLRAREGSGPSTSEGRHSLPHPIARNVSWDEYISAPKGRFPYLGREVIETVETNRVSVVIGLTEEISLEWKGMLEYVNQFLRNEFTAFISKLLIDLPKGFPVVIDWPLEAFIYLKWKLAQFEIVSDIDDSIFSIPDGFQEVEIFTIERNLP